MTTRMLAAVTGPEEALLADAGGADIIEIKDMARGAVAPAVIRATVAALAGRRPISAAAGDPGMGPDALLDAARAVAGCGEDYITVALSREAPDACVRALAPLAAAHRLVAVLFADAAPDFSLLPLLAACGFAGAVLETGGAAPGRLLDVLDIPGLADFVAACRRLALTTGLAGGLEPPDVPRLLLLRPDVLGFRGALCAGGRRTAALDPTRIMAVRRLIPLSADAPAPARAGGPVDHVLVEDFVLPVSIGAYAGEHTARQRVRFAVTAAVPRGAAVARTMGDVFSYDLIMDGIRLLVASGHFTLVETLAEAVAAMVLSHARVVDVSVRVEKLDAGPARVGVAIHRSRPAE